VCSDPADPTPIDTVLVSLVDKSMVALEPSGRYRMLETIKEFASALIAGNDELLRSRHLAYYVTVAEAIHDGLQGPDQRDWCERMYDEWSNLRAAYLWARNTSDVDGAARITCSLMWAAVWHDVGEPYSWADDVAGMAGASQSSRWHDIVAVQARAAWERGRNDSALELGLAALAAEPEGVATIDYFAEYTIVAAAFFRADEAMTADYFERAIRRTQRDGRPVHESFFRSSAAVFHNGYGRRDAARAAAEQGRALAERVGNPTVLTWALAQEGATLALEGRMADAVTILEHGRQIGVLAGFTIGASACTVVLAWVRLTQGEVTTSLELCLEDLRVMRRRAAWMFISQRLAVAMRALAASGAWEEAAIIFGAVSTSPATRSADSSRAARAFHKELAAHLEALELAHLIAYGETLTPDDAAAQGESALVHALDCNVTGPGQSGSAGLRVGSDSGG
jgi:hypothetical protein